MAEEKVEEEQQGIWKGREWPHVVHFDMPFSRNCAL